MPIPTTSAHLYSDCYLSPNHTPHTSVGSTNDLRSPYEVQRQPSTASFMSGSSNTATISSYPSSTYTLSSPTIPSSATSYDKGKERERNHLPNAEAVIGFNPIDPITKMELVDPVLCTNGLIQDRWSVLLSTDLVDAKTGEPLKILGDVLQVSGCCATVMHLLDRTLIAKRRHP